MIKLQILYPLKVPPEVMDDLEQDWADKKVELFVNMEQYPKLEQWMKKHGYEPMDFPVLLHSEGTG